MSSIYWRLCYRRVSERGRIGPQLSHMPQSAVGMGEDRALQPLASHSHFCSVIFETAANQPVQGYFVRRDSETA